MSVDAETAKKVIADLATKMNYMCVSDEFGRVDNFAYLKEALRTAGLSRRVRAF